MHQHPAQAPRGPNSDSMSSQRSCVAGAKVSFNEALRGIRVRTALAAVALVFVLDLRGIGVVAEALLPRQRDKALALGAADQRQPRLARERHARRGEAGAR